MMQTLAELEELACSLQPEQEKTTTGLFLKSLGEVTYLDGEPPDPQKPSSNPDCFPKWVFDELDLWLEAIKSEYRSLTEESSR